MKNILIIGGVALLLLLGGSWWSRSLSGSDADVVAANGIHWHPRLALYVKGVQIEIPAGIGLDAVHLPMHTHDEDAKSGVIHLEFSGSVTTDDLKLGIFFKNWGKDMRSFGSNMTMLVNGVPSTEFEDYVMRDKDVIELRYD